MEFDEKCSMNRWEVDKLRHGDAVERRESHPAGGYVRVTRFRDGSSITNFGGMVAPLHTDRYGEEN